MNYKLIYIFCLFRTIEVVFSIANGFECVKRKSGVCKAFNVTDNFDHFIHLDRDAHRITTIIEIDYMENKYSFEKTKKNKEFDTTNSPLVDILFSERKNPEYSYRLVLGEKLNRLAYVEIVDLSNWINYNNYSPDLPSWPFAINVTIDFHSYFKSRTFLSVYTKNGDGFDKATPFVTGSSNYIEAKYMSVRSRNKNVKLVGFYDCSTKYGFNCGTEKTQIITDCKKIFSPLGSGIFNNYVDMSKFNRLGRKKSEENEYSEIFGVYRRYNDNMHILFTSSPYEEGTYVRLTIGDEISIRVRTYNEDAFEYYERTAVKKGWNQEPSEPNFINVTISSVTKHISIYSLDPDEEEPILTMKLCNYFDNSDTIEYMLVTSDRFKTVDLYYDCCLPNKLDNCHVYNQTEINETTDSSEFTADSTTIRLADEDTTLDLNGANVTLMNENDENSATTLPTEETMESQETTTETSETTQNYDYEYLEYGNDDNNKIIEKKTLNGEEKTKTFLDTRKFHETLSTIYIYANGTSPEDYCPNEIADAKLIQNTESNNIDVVDEYDPDISHLSNSLVSLIG